jgi:hypothetical protein
VILLQVHRMDPVSSIFCVASGIDVKLLSYVI